MSSNYKGKRKTFSIIKNLDEHRICETVFENLLDNVPPIKHKIKLKEPGIDNPW